MPSFVIANCLAFVVIVEQTSTITSFCSQVEQLSTRSSTSVMLLPGYCFVSLLPSVDSKAGQSKLDWTCSQLWVEKQRRSQELAKQWELQLVFKQELVAIEEELLEFAMLELAKIASNATTVFVFAQRQIESEKLS